MGLLKLSDAELFPKLNNVFRAHGWDGTSLSLLSDATGLGRASLYHRFPGGKLQIAEALLDYVERECMPQMLAPLQGPGTPRQRVAAVAECIDAFYVGGRCGCLFDALSLGTFELEFHATIGRLFLTWVDAFAAIAIAAGLDAGAARQRAEQALVEIQGALVFARASGDTAPFARVLAALPQTLCGARR
jgi:TetR/AcrR family transcriptional regulator, lmrAB and yxaGH operons repressor